MGLPIGGPGLAVGWWEVCGFGAIAGFFLFSCRSGVSRPSFLMTVTGMVSACHIFPGRDAERLRPRGDDLGEVYAHAVR